MGTLISLQWQRSTFITNIGNIDGDGDCNINSVLEYIRNVSLLDTTLSKYAMVFEE